MAEATVPTTAASVRTIRITRFVAAPTARSRACSRTRAALSMVKVLATRKVETNRATPAKPSSSVVSLSASPSVAVPDSRSARVTARSPGGSNFCACWASWASVVPLAAVSVIAE
ncbi:hypothetical protein GCM10009578_068930 [Streptomyces rhizosphaericus]